MIVVGAWHAIEGSNILRKLITYTNAGDKLSKEKQNKNEYISFYNTNGESRSVMLPLRKRSLAAGLGPYFIGVRNILYKNHAMRFLARTDIVQYFINNFLYH